MDHGWRVVESWNFRRGRGSSAASKHRPDLRGGAREKGMVPWNPSPTLKPWENHGKTIGKPWENHGKTMGKP